jgi:phospholipid/cholesterol/gamma-HCH transport system ATP-binding protein
MVGWKTAHQVALGRKHPHDAYVVAIFSMNELDLVGLNLGHETAQEVIKSLGAYINKHFGAVGGFSSRQSKDQFVTVLPFSDLKEADGILEDFGRDFGDQGLCDIQADAQIPENECFEFSVLAGLAEGKSGDEIESIIALAKSQQKIIGRFQCEMRR